MSNTQSSTTPTTPNGATVLRWVFLGIAIVLGVMQVKSYMAEVKADRANKVRVAQAYAAAHPPAQVTHPVEALVLMHECTTPCPAHVGWSYKIRTDGDPIRIKYHGCTEWFDQPGKGSFPAPKCFQPGEAQFVSSDEVHPNVKVWVYKKTTVEGGR